MNGLIAICVGIALSSMIIGGVSLVMACMCWARVVGMEKSTHQVQFVPLRGEDGAPIEGEKLDDQMKKAFGEESLEREYI